MDELTFLREKLRREMQEVLNELDKTSSMDEGPEQMYLDLLINLRLVLLGQTVGSYMTLVREVSFAQEDQ